MLLTGMMIAFVWQLQIAFKYASYTVALICCLSADSTTNTLLKSLNCSVCWSLMVWICACVELAGMRQGPGWFGQLNGALLIIAYCIGVKTKPRFPKFPPQNVDKTDAAFTLTWLCKRLMVLYVGLSVPYTGSMNCYNWYLPKSYSCWLLWKLPDVCDLLV